MSVKLVTGLVRFSYAHVWQPKQVKGGEELKYSVSLLFPKKNKNAVKAVKAAIEEAFNEAKDSGKFGKKDPRKSTSFKWALRDGDEEREDDADYKGMYFMNATSKEAPLIGDADKQEIVDEDEFYSGCWGRACVNLAGFNHEGNMGISCYLQSVQKLKDGVKLAGRDSLESAFEEDIDEEEFNILGDFENEESEEEDDAYDIL